MALTSALFTGLSGLSVNQTRLNVVGNNIANVNTVAFKSSRALFTPQFYITDGAGTAPNADFGGTNPNQRGLGAVVSAIEKNFASAALEPTGKPTDLALDGDGFFVLQGTEQRFTRDGSFNLNSANQLVSNDGSFVQGYGVDADGNVALGRLQKIEIPLGATSSAKPTSEVKLDGNLSAAGPAATGATILTSQPLTTLGGAAAPTGGTALSDLASASDPNTALIQSGTTFTLDGTKGGRSLPQKEFTVTSATTVSDLLDFYSRGLGIDTTVPDDGNPATPAPGAAIEADASTTNAATLVITGNLGTDNALALTGTAFSDSSGRAPFAFADGVNAAGIASDPNGESIHTSFVGYDSLGTEVSVDVTAVLESKSDRGNTWRFYATSGDDTDLGGVVGGGTLVFDSEGKLKTTTGNSINIDRAGTGAKSPMVVKLDFDGITALTSRNSNLVMTRQDGTQTGTLRSFSIGADGRVVGSFSNGANRPLAQVAVATFANNQGLVDRGGNQYISGANSGAPIVSAPLELGAGAVRSSALEQSNVDLSQEFVNLIISSTGFSAASRVISTSDQLITELLNSSR